jgi:Carbohydrate-binding module 48 (Isoamylase N-terminal domain)
MLDPNIVIVDLAQAQARGIPDLWVALLPPIIVSVSVPFRESPVAKRGNSLFPRSAGCGTIGPNDMEVLEATKPAAAQLEFLTAEDFHLFSEGTHLCLYQKLGAHLWTRDGIPGVHFAVWAPNAEQVSVMGDFNDWDKAANLLRTAAASGVWTGFVSGVEQGARYKYHIVSRNRGYRVDKADPFGFKHETPPATASLVWDLGYQWHDDP